MNFIVSYCFYYLHLDFLFIFKKWEKLIYFLREAQHITIYQLVLFKYSRD